MKTRELVKQVVGSDDEPIDYMVYVRGMPRVYTAAFSRALTDEQVALIFKDLGITVNDLAGDLDYTPGTIPVQNDKGVFSDIPGEEADLNFPVKGPCGRLKFSLQGSQYQALPRLLPSTTMRLKRLDKTRGGRD